MTDINLIKGDCLTESSRIESGSVDLILTDLPYGNMKNAPSTWDADKTKWDTVIDPSDVFNVANRILRKNGKLVLFSQEPYTSRLINEAIPNVPFSYRMIWEKDNFANALLVNKAPVSYFEDILVFSKNECFEARNPLRDILLKYVKRHGREFVIDLFQKEGRYSSEASARVHASYKMGFNNGKRFDLMDKKMYEYLHSFIKFEESYETLKSIDDEYKLKFSSTFNLWEGSKYKSNILRYKKDYDGFHPTQKPVLLLEDLIKTYSNEGDHVVDLTMGSGSTGVACVNTGRNFTGIEMDEGYFDIAKRRIDECLADTGIK